MTEEPMEEKVEEPTEEKTEAKMEEKVEEPMEEKVEEKVEAKMEEKMEEKAEEKMEEKAEEKTEKRKPRAAAEKKEKTLGKEELVAAIKGMTLLELADLVKALEEEFGVSAAIPVAAGPAAAAATASATEAAAAAAAEEEKTEFTVILKDIGPNRINVIKAVREVTTLGLKEAKELVESAPKPVRENVGKSEAATIKEKLEQAGATVAVE